MKAIKVKEKETEAPLASPAPVVVKEPIPWYVDRFYNGYMDCVEAVRKAETPEEELMTFFKLAWFIYDASYYRDSSSVNYAVLPHASVWLLRHYLELPANQAMLAELKQALNWMQKRSGQMGMIMFRNYMTSIIWDVFLRHHGFSRGGGLSVMFYIPDFQDIRSDFWVKVSYSDFHMGKGVGDEYTRHFCVAVSWMLTGLFSYSEELGLGQRPWKKIEKKFNPQKGGR